MRPGSARGPDAGRHPEAETLGLLGLARRAGAVVPGVGAVRSAVRSGRVYLVLMAGDASPVQLEKITGPARRVEVACRTIADRDRLGAAVGGPPLSAVAVTNEGFAKQLLRTIPESPEDGDVPG